VKPGTRVFNRGSLWKVHKSRALNKSCRTDRCWSCITPLRALLEDLPTSVDVSVIVRGASYEDIVHREELLELVNQRNGRLFELVGSGRRRMDSSELKKLLGSLSNADVYICGPTDFNESITKAVQGLGAREQRIHHESSRSNEYNHVQDPLANQGHYETRSTRDRRHDRGLSRCAEF